MDPCVPGTSLEDARASARAKLGVPAQYASKMTVKSICLAFKLCKKTNIMPPMDYRRFGNKVYLIDPKSPLSIQDFMMVLGPGQLSDVQKIAKKLGLMTEGITKSELKTNIIKILQTLNISEPVEIPSRKVQAVVSENLGYGTNYNVTNQTSVPNVIPNNNKNYVNTSPMTNYNNNLGPESGETPYSNEVAPNYFKLKPRPSFVNEISPKVPSRSQYYNDSPFYMENYLRGPNTKKSVIKPSPSKLYINASTTPVSQQQINENMKRIKRLKNLITPNTTKISGGTQTNTGSTGVKKAAVSTGGTQTNNSATESVGNTGFETRSRSNSTVGQSTV